MGKVLDAKSPPQGTHSHCEKLKKIERHTYLGLYQLDSQPTFYIPRGGDSKTLHSILGALALPSYSAKR